MPGVGPSSGQQGIDPLVLRAAMAHEDHGTWAGRTFRRPDDARYAFAGDLQRERALGDSHFRDFGSELHFMPW